MSEFFVNQIVDLVLTPPEGFTLPADPQQWSIDNPALATLDANGVPVKLTLGANPGTVNVTVIDGPITATLAIPFGLPVATTGTIVAALDPASPAT
jgi:hypothetical protein